MERITNEQRREALTKRILRDCKFLKEKNPLVKQARWLNSNFQLEQNFMLSPRKKIISNTLLDTLIDIKKKYKIKQKQICLEVMIANLLQSHFVNKPLSMSMWRNDYPAHKRSRTPPFIIECVHLLHKGGYIMLVPGKHFDSGNSFITRIWPDKTLIQLFSPLDEKDIKFEPMDLITLTVIPRDKNGRKKGKRIIVDYVDNKITRQVRNQLKVINRVNSDTLIRKILYTVEKTEYIQYGAMQTDLHAVYNKTFHLGGRLYTSTLNGYQQLNKDERSAIIMDGKPTVELDFSGYHPYILYAWEDIQYDDDPYEIIPEIPEMRQVFKMLFMYVLNAPNETLAIQAGNTHLRKKRKLWNLIHEYGFNVKDDLIPVLREFHPKINKYFCTDAGLKAMNFDSRIALNILSHFANKGIPILCIHDSFIVQKRHKKELKEVMKLAYKELTNGFLCPVNEVKKPEKKQRKIRKK